MVSSVILPAARQMGRITTPKPRIFAATIALAGIVQFLLFAFFVVRTEIISPISDSFAYIDDYLQFRAGRTSLLEYLWHAHAEHHLVWIRFLTWAHVAIFHTRATPFTIAATIAITATAVLICNELRRAEPKLGTPTGFALLAPMVVLSSANAIDCSLPINTTYTFTVFFAVLSLVLFTSEGYGVKSPVWRIFAIAAALGSSFGTAAGLLMWPLLFWLAGKERLGWPWKGTLAGLGFAYCLFYLQGLQFLGLGPSFSAGVAKFFSFAHLHKLADYFFVFLGLPFTRYPEFETIGRLIGFVLFLAGACTALVTIFSKRFDTRLDRIAVAMMLFAIGAAGLATLGRGDMIEEVKVPVRYTMFTTLLQVGLMCIILPRIVRMARMETLTNAIALSFAVALLILQVFIGRAAVAVADTISREAGCFAEGTPRNPVSQVVTRWPDDANRVLANLRKQGLWASRASLCTAQD